MLLAATPAISSALKLHPLQRFHDTHRSMGTEFTLDLYARNQAQADSLFELAFDEIDRIDDLLSNYKPSSELSRISQDAATAPIVTDPETFLFLKRSLYWSYVSNGAFDITVGPLLRSWGLFQHEGHVPSDAELATARGGVGWRKIALDPATRSVRFSGGHPLDLDPGSIGKGFAVDAVIALLREQGVTRAFLSAGSSTLYGLGTPPGKGGWPVTIPDPRSPTSSATLYLHNMSLSTGACTVKFFVLDGHRYCHIFDPRTGKPVEGTIQTTVLSPSATDSDALSTVVFVLSPDASARILKNRPSTSALIYLHTDARPACVAIRMRAAHCTLFP
jgi:thiamine biosynthesis lipoprotein